MILQTHDGVLLDSQAIGDARIMMVYKLPLSEIIVDFYDNLKSISSGYARYGSDSCQ